nr:PREDICTED: uncharacterized protein LOC104244150 isoform X2 [Nicotiana sylvestris]
MKTTEHTLNQAYAMITQDESQQSLGGSEMAENVDSMAMQVGRGQVFRGMKQLLQCEHCHRKGHTKENYFKIIGCPKDFKGKKNYQTREYMTKGPFTEANNVEEPATSNSRGVAQQKGDYFFNKAQYQQILHLLIKDSNVDNQTQANMAGLINTMTKCQRSAQKGVKLAQVPRQDKAQVK